MTDLGGAQQGDAGNGGPGLLLRHQPVLLQPVDAVGLGHSSLVRLVLRFCAGSCEAPRTQHPVSAPAVLTSKERLRLQLTSHPWGASVLPEVSRTLRLGCRHSLAPRPHGRPPTRDSRDPSASGRSTLPRLPDGRRVIIYTTRCTRKAEQTDQQFLPADTNTHPGV